MNLDESFNESSNFEFFSDFDEMKFQKLIFQIMHQISKTRVLIHNAFIIKSNALLNICLIHYKIDRHDFFRIDARINFDTFDLLTKCLKTQFCFQNDFINEQMFVIRQNFIILKRFDIYDNDSSFQNIANWTEIKKNIVDFVIRRIFLAIHEFDLQKTHIRWSIENDSNREETKDWIENTEISKQWRHDWCMIDETIISLFEKFHYYENAFFDRKHRYFINVQIINIFYNNQIIDYASSFNENRHDSHCFEQIYFHQQHSFLLTIEEWCWTDVTYSLRDWLISSFKKSNNRFKINKKFNYNLFRIRIRSEHAIEYLKKRFCSLKELRIQIRNEKNIRYVVVWINVCIVFHVFAIDEKTYSLDFAKNDYIWKHEKRKLDKRKNENISKFFENQKNKFQMLREDKIFRKRLKSYL